MKNFKIKIDLLHNRLNIQIRECLVIQIVLAYGLWRNRQNKNMFFRINLNLHSPNDNPIAPKFDTSRNIENVRTHFYVPYANVAPILQSNPRIEVRKTKSELVYKTTRPKRQSIIQA